ncbi:hypothetical protein B0H10DRAFT_2235817 [Mycena sp. CBHHK59/15]|nr:hypothetical protein B0H10DRAFT_2235817 [Mycena sp. CBHHK59/15]
MSISGFTCGTKHLETLPKRLLNEPNVRARIQIMELVPTKKSPRADSEEGDWEWSGKFIATSGISKLCEVDGSLIQLLDPAVLPATNSSKNSMSTYHFKSVELVAIAASMEMRTRSTKKLPEILFGSTFSYRTSADLHASNGPCLVKSQSRIPAADWDSTPAKTNTGEAQQHWMNSLTGTKLSLVEAIESAREVDENVARKIAASIDTGILTNPHNEAYHRMSRNLLRQATAAHEKESRRESSAREKELRDQLKYAKGSTSINRAKGAKVIGPSVIISASSSGRVKTAKIVSSTTSLSCAPVASLTESTPPLHPVDAHLAVNGHYQAVLFPSLAGPAVPTGISVAASASMSQLAAGADGSPWAMSDSDFDAFTTASWKPSTVEKSSENSLFNPTTS